MAPWMVLLYLACAGYLQLYTINIVGCMLPAIIGGTHKVVVALKYATLSPTEYESAMKGEANAGEYQLYEGWFKLNDNVFDFEIAASALRNGIEISELVFTIPPKNQSKDNLGQHRNWVAFLLGKETVDGMDSARCTSMRYHSDGSHSVSGYDLLKRIIKQADSSVNKMWAEAIVVSMALMAGLLHMFAFAYGKEDVQPNEGHSVQIARYLLYTSSSFSSVVGYIFISRFVLVSLHDVYRQHTILHIVGRLMRYSDLDLVLDTQVKFFTSAEGGKVASQIRRMQFKQLSAIDQYIDRMTASSPTNHRNAGACSTVEGSDVYTPSHPSLNTDVEEWSIDGHGQGQGGQGQGKGKGHAQGQGRGPHCPNETGDDSDDEDVVTLAQAPTSSSSSLPSSSATLNPLSLELQHDDTKIKVMPARTGTVTAPRQWTDDSSGGGGMVTVVVADSDDPHHQSESGDKSDEGMDLGLDLGSVVRVNEALVTEEHDFACVPRIDARDSRNIMAWAALRIIAVDFGRRFRFRLNVFVAIMVVLAIVLVGEELLVLFVSGKYSYGFSPFFAQSLIFVGYLYFFVLLLSYMGALANGEADKHRAIVATHILQSNRQLANLKHMMSKMAMSQELDKEDDCDGGHGGGDEEYEGDGTGGRGGGGRGGDKGSVERMRMRMKRRAVESAIGTLEECLSRWESCRDSVETTNMALPVTVMGIAAQFGLVSTLVSSGVSLAGVIYSLYANISTPP